MITEAHCDALGDPRTDHIAHRRSPQIMDDDGPKSGFPTCLRPRLAEVTNRPATAVKDKWAIQPSCPRDTLDQVQQLSTERENSSILVLVNLRSKSHDLPFKVHVAPSP